MMPYKHILCPTDFSACSDEACAHACEMASESGAKLTLLHVVEHFPQDRSNEEVAPENLDPKAFRQATAMKALEKQAAGIDCPDVAVEVIFSSHSSAYGILRYAAMMDVDLIVMATHAQGWLDAVFGDTAGYVRRKARCEVLVVPTD